MQFTFTDVSKLQISLAGGFFKPSTAVVLCSSGVKILKNWGCKNRSSLKTPGLKVDNSYM